MDSTKWQNFPPFSVVILMLKGKKNEKKPEPKKFQESHCSTILRFVFRFQYHIHVSFFSTSIFKLNFHCIYIFSIDICNTWDDSFSAKQWMGIVFPPSFSPFINSKSFFNILVRTAGAMLMHALVCVCILCVLFIYLITIARPNNRIECEFFRSYSLSIRHCCRYYCLQMLPFDEDANRWILKEGEKIVNCKIHTILCATLQDPAFYRFSLCFS